MVACVAAVDQNLESLLPARIIGCVDQVLGAGYSTGRAEKLDVGQEASPEMNRFQSRRKTGFKVSTFQS
jgi:hypothetical protein